MLSAAAALLPTHAQSEETTNFLSDLGNNDDFFGETKRSWGKVFKNVAKLDKNGDVKYIASHRSHMSHRSGGGGGGTLSLIAQEPLNYDSSTSTLSLIYDTKVLKVDNSSGTAKLTLNIAAKAPFTTTNGLSLAIDNKGGLKQNSNNELYVEGTHKTIIKTGTVDDIKVNNYIYQEI